MTCHHHLTIIRMYWVDLSQPIIKLHTIHRSTPGECGRIPSFQSVIKFLPINIKNWRNFALWQAPHQ
jgi:hypothetical protein